MDAFEFFLRISRRIAISLRWLVVFLFVNIPVWLFQNIVLEGLRQVGAWFTGLVRRYVLWIIGGVLLLGLIQVGNKELLNNLVLLAAAVAALVVGVRIMLGAFSSNGNNHRRRR